jgi:hypothetical protein
MDMKSQQVRAAIITSEVKASIDKYQDLTTKLSAPASAAAITGQSVHDPLGAQ